MKIVNLDTPSGWRIGSLVDDLVVDLNRAAQLARQPDGPIPASLLRETERALPADIQRWLELPTDARLGEARQALEAGTLLIQERGVEWARDRQLVCPLSAAVLAPPVPPTATILAIGLNYHGHAAEANMEIPKFPMVLAKPSGTLAGHRAPIAIPRASHRIDYEGELAVVIGGACKEVAEADALDYVAGYTIANDLSARDWQFRTSEMMIGKAFDGFCPLGPWLVTSDELPDPHALRLRTTVSGEQRQDASTGEMIFRVPALVAYLSQVMTLRPGDVILTSTPAGIGATRQPRLWLRPGDVVEVEVEGIGTLTTPIVEG